MHRRFVFPNHPDALRTARQNVLAFTSECGMSEADAWDIVIAVGEACANAVEHGYAPDSTITIDCACKEGWIEIQVSDAGGGIAVHERTWQPVVRRSATGGLGMQIMRQLMTSAELERVPNKGAIVRLRKRLA